jgi:hypothetical protein
MGKVQGLIFTIVPAVLIIGLGIILSLKTGQWHWFARSGSLLIAHALVIFSRATIKSRLATRLEFALAIIGTLIWGFGDLIGS